MYDKCAYFFKYITIFLIDFKVGEWVLFMYEGSAYPGEILSINESERELTINAMEPMPKNLKLFKWPKLKDINAYPFEDVISKIGPPIALDKRGVTYKFLDII